MLSDKHAALIQEQYQYLPELLKPIWGRHFHLISERVAEQDIAWPQDEAFWQSLLRVCVSSDFIALSYARFPEWVHEMFQAGTVMQACDIATYEARLQALMQSVDSPAAMMNALREFRLKEMLRIGWRNAAKFSTILEEMQELSDLADVCIQSAVKFSLAHFNLKVDFIVLAMGKLGAHELNLSSDIDLIFAVDGIDQAQQELVIQAAQMVIDLLHTKTELGRVFRVDMRLRPFGDSGALVPSLRALIDYYEKHGRDWERYALIKYRMVFGSEASEARLSQDLRPFVYRRYVDFAMQSAIRNMKAMIEAEVKRKAMQHHIKLGSGGIREIEFTVQALQLIYAGQYPLLQQPRLKIALNSLVQFDLLSEADRLVLWQGYVLLRRIEHKLQLVQDKQTHLLPSSDLERCRIAYVLCYDSWTDLEAEIEAVRGSINHVFRHLLSHVPSVKQASPQAKSNRLSRLRRKHPVGQAEVISDTDSLLTQLQKKGVSAEAMRQIQQLLVRLKSAVQSLPDPNKAEQDGKALFAKLATRPTYLNLLLENDDLIEALLPIMLASKWVEERLLRYPFLLSQLLHLIHHPDRLLPPIKRIRDRFLLGICYEDSERWMEALRHLKLSRVLAIVMADLRQELSVTQMSALLSELAACIIHECLEAAWDHVIQQYGTPREASRTQKHFVVIAYGKLGSQELNIQSDLDLVFLYNGNLEDKVGDKEVSLHEFYAKLAQRLVLLLKAPTYSGQLYDIDLRLRPSGRSGLLVSNFDAFQKYQEASAWTWEHQALSKALPVAGDKQLFDVFLDIKRDILTGSKQPETLRRDISEMRDKLFAEKTMDTDTAAVRQLMISVEFLLQYLLLLHAKENLNLLRAVGNLALIEALKQGDYLSQPEADSLHECYVYCQHTLSDFAVGKPTVTVDTTELASHQQIVDQYWRAFILL